MISPYNANNKKLRELPIVKAQARELKVGTVEGFQAQVKSVVLLVAEISDQHMVIIGAACGHRLDSAKFARERETRYSPRFRICFESKALKRYITLMPFSFHDTDY